jgi:hypothetical protein
MSLLIETKFYTRLRKGKYQYTPGNIFAFANSGVYSKPLTQKLSEFLFHSMPQRYLLRSGILFFAQMIESEHLQVHVVPKRLFVAFRRDLSFTYYDSFKRMVETKEVGSDTITLYVGDRIIVFVPEGTKSFAHLTVMSKFLARQLLHELGHFAYQYVWKMKYMKFRLFYPFYDVLLFKNMYNIHDALKVPILLRYLTWMNRFEFSDFVELSQLRRVQNFLSRYLRADDLKEEVKERGFDIFQFWEALLRRKQLEVNVDELMWISNIIKEQAYPAIWQGTRAIWDKHTLFYQEVISPSEILARVLEGVQRSYANKPVLQHVITQLEKALFGTSIPRFEVPSF